MSKIVYSLNREVESVGAALEGAVPGSLVGEEARVKGEDGHDLDLVVAGYLSCIVKHCVVVDTQVIAEPNNESAG